MSNLQVIPSKEYPCKCGKNFTLFKRLKYHVDTTIFCFDCLICGRGTNSWAHLKQHYRKIHPTQPLPIKSTIQPYASPSPGHSTHLEIEHLRQRSSKIPSSLLLRNFDAGFVEWLNDVPGASTPLALVDNSDFTPPPQRAPSSISTIIAPPPPPQRAASPQPSSPSSICTIIAPPPPPQRAPSPQPSSSLSISTISAASARAPKRCSNQTRRKLKQQRRKQEQENPHKLLVQRAKANLDADDDIAFYILE